MLEENLILSLSHDREAMRKAYGHEYLSLIHVSLAELVNECGGQMAAAKVIENFYGYPCSQSTISRACSGGLKKKDNEKSAIKVQSQLRFAVHCFKVSQSASAQVKMISHFGRLPIHHDIIKVDGRLALFLGFELLSRTLQIKVYVNGEFKTVAANSVEII